MAYMLDADVFIRAKNLHYGFDFCPAFWDWLVRANAQELVFSMSGSAANSGPVTTVSPSGPRSAAIASFSHPRRRFFQLLRL